MARRVDEVQLVELAVRAAIVEPHGLGLDGDAALALEIHGIEHLLLHLPRAEPPQSWISRSARVDLPWSIWAMMEKLRMRESGGASE